MKGFIFSAIVALAILVGSVSAQKDTVLFREVVADLEVKSKELFKHPFFKRLEDETIPIRRRMTVVPYWTYFAMGFADVVDTWFYISNPQNELEERVNMYVSEDNFHYNFFLHDVENVLGYTLDRYGSYAAVMRHLWGDDSRAVREYIYGWLDCVNRYKDPVITLATFEAVEMNLKPLFDTMYTAIFLPENGIKELKYFGQEHVELEINHTQFNWFNQGVTPFLSLEDVKITLQQRDRALEVSEDLYKRCVQLIQKVIKNEVIM